MPRERGGTGVGRGNGTGSRRGQFKTGQASGNPKGRPKKPRQQPTDTMKEAITRLLIANVMVTVGPDKKQKRMRCVDAVAEQMLEQLATASLRDKLSFFRAIGGFETNIKPPYVMPERTAELLVQELAQEAIRCGYPMDLPAPEP